MQNNNNTWDSCYMNIECFEIFISAIPDRILATKVSRIINVFVYVEIYIKYQYDHLAIYYLDLLWLLIHMKEPKQFGCKENVTLVCGRFFLYVSLLADLLRDWNCGSSLQEKQLGVKKPP